MESPQPPPEPRRVLVRPFAALGEATPEEALRAVDALETKIRERSALDVDRTDEACAVSDAACLAGQGKARGAEAVLAGELSRNGTAWIWSVRRVRTSDGRTTLAARQASGSLDKLLEQSPSLAEELFPPPPESGRGRVFAKHNIRPDRTLMKPTALALSPGTLSLDFLYLGVVDLGYQLTEHLNLGTLVLVPAYMGAVAPHVEMTYQIADMVHVGGILFGGVFYPMWESFLFYGFGGGPTLTIGRPDMFLNVNLMVMGWGADDLDDEYDDVLSDEAVFLPTVGGMIQVHDMVFLGADLSVPITTNLDEGTDQDGQVWLVHYGVRLQGDIAYGDVGFWVPLSEWWFDTDDIDNGLVSWFPLGVPYFKFGFVF